MFDLDKLTDSINSGTIEMPSGLTRGERQVYIRDKLKELGYEVQPLGRKYDPEACMRAVQSYLASAKGSDNA